MNLQNLKLGYYQEYDAGDGSMYDHCTSYQRSPKNYTIFQEEGLFYYDVLNDNKPYRKDSEYGDTLVTIDSILLDILPSFIDPNKDYSLEEILLLLPKKILEEVLKSQNKRNL